MSHAASNWAWDIPLPANEKLALLCLADYADDNDSCFPGQEKLAARMNCSIRTVGRVMKSLEDQGLVTRERRMNAIGQRTSDRYYLHRTDRPVVEQPDNPGRATGQSGSSNTTTVSDTKEPSEEPSERTVRRESGGNIDGLFDDAWFSWPNKNNRKGARAKFGKLAVRQFHGRVEELHKAIITHGEAYRATTETKFIPHLLTWLNRDGWNDPVPAPTANQPWNAPPKNMSAAERRRATLHDAIAQAREMDAQRAAQNLSAGELDR